MAGGGRRFLAGVAGALLAGLLLAPVAVAGPPDVKFDIDRWLFKDGERLFIRVLDTVPGQSACTGACADVWSTLAAAADAVADHGWTVEAQADGRKIWAYNGKPVYFLRNPDRTTYNSASAEWLIARATPWFPPGVRVDDKGLLELEGAGRLKTPRTIACDSTCKAHWLPFRPAPDAVSWQDWSIVETPEGERVWGYGASRRLLYIENPDSPPPPRTDDDIMWQSPMLNMTAYRFYAQLDPIIVPAGSVDIHHPSVTKAPVRSPGATTPKYPPASLRAAETGYAVVQVCIGADGFVSSQKLARSSDFARLDEATLAWTGALAFAPGEIDGKPVAVCGYTIDFNWTIPR